MDRFKALVATKGDGGLSISWTDLGAADLMDGDVDVRITHTTVNYKDGLALTGKGPIIRRFPLIPGIDFAGTVVASSNPGFAVGDGVLLNGWGVGETHHGGYSQMARVQGRLAARSGRRGFRRPRRWRSERRDIPPCCACWRWNATT